MDKKDRSETINILDWLEEDTKQELRKEERADYLKIKTKLVKLKTDAILEMYRSIQESKDDRDKCLEALGKVHLCWRGDLFLHPYIRTTSSLNLRLLLL